jgi:hypothetical protein
LILFYFFDLFGLFFSHTHIHIHTVYILFAFWHCEVHIGGAFWINVAPARVYFFFCVSLGSGFSVWKGGVICFGRALDRSGELFHYLHFSYFQLERGRGEKER